MTVDGKADGSPVTEADLAADRIIAEGLARLAAGHPGAVGGARSTLATPPYAGSFFLIDPLDGTKEFVAGRDEFTVNLALVTDGTPLLGIVGAPALGLIWRGMVGRGAERLTLAPDGRISGPSRSAPARFPRRGPALDRRGQPLAWRRPDRSLHRRPGPARSAQMLGSAVKFGRVAEGARRHLSPAGADLRMGRRGRPRRGDRGRRQGHGLPRARRCASAAGASDFIVPEFIAWGDPAAAAR